MSETGDPEAKGENRRRFIVKLAYMAPVMETFLLKEPAEGQGAQGNKKPKPSRPKKGQDANDQGENQ
jgi:hypothetical protein